MNREELEKMFDEVFEGAYYRNHTHLEYELKEFIFDTIIPEVLRKISPRTDYWFCDKNQIKQKAKELYWIDL